MTGRRTRAAVVVLTAALCVWGCRHKPKAGDFRIGQTRAELVERFGEPAKKTTLRKSGEPIFGPIETFWDSLSVGDVVELWSYPVDGGSVELYFVDGSEDVKGTGYAPAGAVY